MRIYCIYARMRVMSKVQIEVKKNGNENNTNLLRRFSRKVMDSGIVPTVKGKRYNERPMSKLSEKEMMLRKIDRRKEIEKLKKLGKLPDRRS